MAVDSGAWQRHEPILVHGGVQGPRAEGPGVVTSIPSSERRRDRRLEIPVSCRIRFADLVGEPSEELTITENISQIGRAHV